MNNDVSVTVTLPQTVSGKEQDSRIIIVRSIKTEPEMVELAIPDGPKLFVNGNLLMDAIRRCT